MDLVSFILIATAAVLAVDIARRVNDIIIYEQIGQYIDSFIGDDEDEC